MCHELHKSYHSMEQEDKVELCLEVAVLKDEADLLHRSLDSSEVSVNSI